MAKYASYEAIAKYDAEAAYLHILLGKVRPFCCRKQHTCLSAPEGEHLAIIIAKVR